MTHVHGVSEMWPSLAENSGTEMGHDFFVNGQLRVAFTVRLIAGDILFPQAIVPGAMFTRSSTPFFICFLPIQGSIIHVSISSQFMGTILLAYLAHNDQTLQAAA